MGEDKKGLLIRIEESKKELLQQVAKYNGMSMNDFINNAIDIALSIETKETVQLSRDKELLEHELKSLEENKEIYLKNYNEDKELIQQKIKQIDLAINDINVEIEENSEKESYEHLVNLVYSGRKINSIKSLIEDHASNYNLDVEELQRKILNDSTNKKFRR